MMSSIRYKIGRFIFRVALRCYYRKTQIVNEHNIPDDKPVLFISNHNNAFIDPLLLTTNQSRRITLTAKHTLAQNPLLRIIIWFCSIVLLHRQSDSESAGTRQSSNSAALQALKRRFSSGEAVYIFPEGKSHSESELQPFKTGPARLALDYAKDCSERNMLCDLVIVPLGLHYSAKHRFRSDALVNVGEPISLADWCNQNDVTNAKSLTTCLYKAVDKLSNEKVSSEYHATANTHTNGRKWSDQLKVWELRIIAAMGAIPAIIANFLPFVMTWLTVKKLSSEPDHPASAAVVTGLVFFPSAFLLFTALMLLNGYFLAWLISVLLFIPSSIAALYLVDQLDGLRNAGYKQSVS